ncbi:MAG: hypothetical protein AAF357_13205, partial [Verrucomicrobiota bacterium]
MGRELIDPFSRHYPLKFQEICENPWGNHPDNPNTNLPSGIATQPDQQTVFDDKRFHVSAPGINQELDKLSLHSCSWMEQSLGLKRLYLIYTLGLLALIIANKLGESSCWFYSDARGEYSFSELFTNVLYLSAAIVLLVAARKRKNGWLIVPALGCLLLLAEEANYGQIFWSSGSTPLFENE